MRPISIVRYEDRLGDLFEKAKAIVDDELQSHWAKYLCVLTCGYLEVAVPAIYSEYVLRRAAPEITTYVRRRLERFKSPKHGNILKIVGSFNGDWETDLKTRTDGVVKDHIDSLVANRHLIAHGKDSGVRWTPKTGRPDKV